jgi:gliding motility-associated-like protein
MKPTFFLTIVFFLSFPFKSVAIDVKPVWSGTINGGFVMVGNTNTELRDMVSGDILDLPKEQGDLKYITIFPNNDNDLIRPTNTGGTITIKNINRADFCIPESDIDICENDTVQIAAAYLSWGGRTETDTPDKNKVYVCVGDMDNFSTNAFFEVTADKSGYIEYIGSESGRAGFYSCHADITEYLNQLITEGSLVLGEKLQFYVANIVTETENFGTPGLFSGWNLTIVYQKEILPKRRIMIYQSENELLGKSNTNAGTPDGLFAEFNFSKEGEDPYQYSIDDIVTFGFSGFGGFKEIGNEFIYCNRNKSITNGNYITKSSDIIPFLTQGNMLRSEDSFGSSIYYSYPEDCGIVNDISYTRGFDMHITRLEPQNFKYITKGDTSFNIYISPANEHHFLTNAVLMVGTPNIPEANLAVELNSTNLNPGEEYTFNLYISVGENQEGLSDIKLVIPVSEYVESVTAISVEPLPKISNSGKESIKIYDNLTYLYNFRMNNVIAQTFNANVSKSITTYLKANNEQNENYANGTEASYQINSKIEIEFPNLLIPPDIKNQDVIKITFTMKTKPEGNPVYNKTALLNKPTILIPQAELALTTKDTKETSVFESNNNKDVNWTQYRCNRGSGGGAGGGSGGGSGGGDDNNPGCSGLTGYSVTENGIYKKNDVDLIEITINAKGDCTEIPDTIRFSFCNELSMPISSLELLLKNKQGFDIDSIAKRDSLLWEQIKRDSILAFSKRHGINKSLMEELLGSGKNPVSIYAENNSKYNDLIQFLECQTNIPDVKLLADTIDSIINMKTEVSRLLVLFDQKDTLSSPSALSPDFAVTPRLSITDEAAQNIIIEVTEEYRTAYLFFDSPWFSTKNNNASCDSFIVVEFKKKNITDPSVIYGKDTLNTLDTLYFCKEADLPPLTVVKTDRIYDVYLDIIESPDSNANMEDQRINSTFAAEFEWDISKQISSSESGVYAVVLKQQDVGGCWSEGFEFYISISNIKLDMIPEIDKSEDEFCQSFSKEDSIQLKVLSAEDPDGNLLNIKWYSVGEDKADLTFLGSGESINVPQDIAGTFAYAASFEKNHCESSTDMIYITVNPWPDTIPPATIPICQGYVLTESDVLRKVKKTASSDTLYWYQYIKYGDGLDTTFNISHSVKEDSISLSRLLSEKLTFDYGDGCEDQYLVVRPKTAKGCFGAGSLITIKKQCYNNSTPTFENGVDSILYCVGDTPAGLNDFINDKQGNHNDKWFWFDNKNDLPGNAFDGNYFNKTPVAFPQNTANPYKKYYYVVRVDSNSCVSKPNEFRVVVDNSINTFPMIDDLTRVIPSGETTLNLHYCEGVYIYSNDFLPAKPYPSASYELEWYKKSGFEEDCETVAGKPAIQKLNSVRIDFQTPDTIFYCVRQSTRLGCKGPWLNVAIVVNDSVREKPILDPIKLCQGAGPLNIKQYVENPDAGKYLLNYYDVNKDLIFVGDANIQTDLPGEFTEINGNSLYYVSLNDKGSGCAGQLVGFDTYVSKKPELPLVETSTLYLCREPGEINLIDYTGAKVHPADTHTRLVWNPAGSIQTGQEADRHKYNLFQQDTLSGCEGEKIYIEVSVEKTFTYNPIDTVELCSNKTFDIEVRVKNSIKKKNGYNIIKDTKIGYTIRRLNGITIGSLVQNPVITSTKNNYNDDIQRFYIEVLDTVSNCFVSDTATIIFRSLPVIEPIDDIVTCQFRDMQLPTPANAAYCYEWERADGSRIKSPEQFQLESSEYIRLIATTIDTLECTENTGVYIEVNQNPVAALVQSDTFCQYTGVHILPYTKIADLEVSWKDQAGNDIPGSIDTDISLSGNLTLKYTARQTNMYTGCYKDTTVSFRINKAFSLQIPDFQAVCEPDSIHLKKSVELYLNSSYPSLGIQGIGEIEYFRLVNNNAVKINEDKVGYYPGRDRLQYIYTVEDARKICRAADTVWVTINRKPEIPLIEKNGRDTIYLCSSNAPLYLVAKNMNRPDEDTKIVWEGSTEGNRFEIPDNVREKIYTVLSVNNNTLCKSASDSVTVIIAEPIETSVIGKNGILEYCAGENVNLYEIAFNSFKADLKESSKLILSATKNNYNIRADNLTAVNETKQDTATYVFTLTDELTGCSESNSVKVIFHALPKLQIDGATTICRKELLQLQATGESRAVNYFWRYRVDGNNESTDKTLFVTDLMSDTTVFLIGRLIDKDVCADTISRKITVNPLPGNLDDYRKEFYFCQDTLAADEIISLNRSETDKTKYYLKWYNQEEEEMSSSENISVSVKEAQTYIFFVKQIDKQTQCEGEPSKVTIVIQPQIKIRLKNPDPVCAPNTFDLENYTMRPEYAFVEGNILRTSGFTSIQNNGTESEVDDPLKINKSGTYKSYYYYEDNIRCEATGKLSVTIYEKLSLPVVPDLKIDFCQNTGSQLLNAIPTGENTKLQWADETGIFSDSVSVQTSNIITGKEYKARQIHTLNGCVSKEVPVKVFVHPEIRPMLTDTVLCYGSSLNLEKTAKEKVTGGTNPYPDSYMSLEPVLFDRANIIRNGKFVVTYKDNSNVCTASDTLKITFDEDIDLTVTGDVVACAGGDIRLNVEGNEFYTWTYNENKVGDTNNIHITNLQLDDSDALQEEKTITLEANRIIDAVKNQTCRKSRDIKLTVKKVPELFTGKRDTSYCQHTAAAPLALMPTHINAKMEWIEESVPDEIFENSVLRPSTVQAGKYLYQFRQSLDGCYTPYQDYTVLIQEEIKTKAIIKDTAYCVGEAAVPLNAGTGSNEYTVKWYDENNTEIVSLPFTPSTQQPGKQYFYAKLSKGICTGEMSQMTIDVQSPYPNIPETKDLVILCRNTGEHILQAKADVGATLNWYTSPVESGRADSVIIRTDNITPEDKIYFVSQSTLKGCESERAEIKVRIEKDIRPLTIRIDTCANSHFTVADIMRKENITGTVDTLWQGNERNMRIALGNNIGKNNVYQFSIYDENNCRAIHTIETNTYKIENLFLDNKDKYCHGDSVCFKASAGNAKEFIWIEEATGNTIYGDVYNKPVFGKSDFLLIAVENILECKDSVYFSVDTYPVSRIRIDGLKNICAGDATTLTVDSPLTGIEWLKSGSVTHTGKEASFLPEQSEHITVRGKDLNNCLVTYDTIINVVNMPTPVIGITSYTRSTLYHINKDTTEVLFKEKALPEYENNPYEYKWDFGDGETYTESNSNYIFHTYSDKHVKPAKAFNVKLTVSHKFGCEKSTTSRILIDPDIKVPNTYVQGEGIFMESYDLQIFDRIGNLIYEGIGWDGTYKGQPAFADTYFYAITYYIEGEKNIKTGYITLVR